MKLRTLGLLLAMHAADAVADGGDFAPLTVRVNGVERGTPFVRVDAGEPCLSLSQLRELGAPEAALPKGSAETDCLSAARLAPAITLKLDATTALLDLQIDPTLLAAQTVSGAEPLETIPAQYPRSAFLNYGLDLSRADQTGKVEVLAPLELAIRNGRWLADTTLLARGGGVQRLFSVVSLDVPERLATLRIGDISTSGTATAGTALLGLQWARNFAYEPLVRRTPGLDFTGVLDTPSTIEVYLDERLVSRRELPAGPYTLQDLPALAGGASTVRVEIVDAFGKRRSVEQPYYLGGGLLNKGESEFSYNLGLPRMAGATDHYAGEPAFSFSHRRGLYESLTAGVEGEASQGLGVVGGRLDAGLGLAGEVSAGIAASMGKGEQGHSGFAAYRYSRQRLNFSTDYSERSEGFRTLAGAVAQARRALRLRVGASLPGGYNSALTYSRTAAAGEVIDRYGASLNGRLGRAGTLSLNADWQADTGETSLLLLFSSVIGNNTLAQAFAGDDASQRQYGVRVNASPAGYTGMGYRADFMQTMADDAEAREDYTAEYELRAQRFTARATRSASGDEGNSRLALAGSFAYADGSWGLGQPIRGSFVTVELPGIAGAGVFADGRQIGLTGAGPVLVTDLAPFLPHTLSVQAPGDLPIGVDLGVTNLRLVLADRSGQPLRFAARRLRLYEGTVVRGDEAGSAVEFTPVNVFRDGAMAAQTVTGENGYLYLEFLAPGAYWFEVRGSKPCRFSAQLLEDDAPVTALGTLVCRAEQSASGS